MSAADLEKKAYARGYAAGRKRARADNRVDQQYAKNSAFLDRAFLAALPATMVVDNWTRGDKKITNVNDRVALAWDIAALALKNRRYP